MNIQKWLILFSACILVQLSFSGCTVQASREAYEDEYHAQYGMYSGTSDLALYTDLENPADELPYYFSMLAGDMHLTVLDSLGTEIAYHSLTFGFNQKGDGVFALTGKPGERYTLRIHGNAVDLKLRLGMDGIQFADPPNAPDFPDLPDPPDAPEPPDLPDLPDFPDAPEPPNAPDPPDASKLTRFFGYELLNGTETIHFQTDSDAPVSFLPYRYELSGSMTLRLLDDQGVELEANPLGFGLVMEGNGNFELPGNPGSRYTLELKGSAANVSLYLPMEGIVIED